MDPILGTVFLFAGSFAPLGYLFCDGQTLPIKSNEALFSILGITYGGDGTTNFAVPHLVAPKSKGEASALNYIIATTGIYPQRP